MKHLLGLGFAIAVASCGGGDTDYFGAPPAEAADDLAAAACELYECGRISIDCGDPPIASYDPYPDEATCVADVRPVYFQLFTGCAALGLTDEQRDDLNACFNGSLECTPESELAAFAEAVCNGQPLPGVTEECARAQATLADCGVCAEDPTDSRCDGATGP